MELQIKCNTEHGGKMLKISLKDGQYVNIGDDIRVVYVGGSGNHGRLLIRSTIKRP